jgi:serine O-acetyltransferase
MASDTLANPNHQPQRSTLALIRSDLHAMIFDRGHHRLRKILTAVLKVLLFPRIRAVVYYRLSHLAIAWRLDPIAYAFQQFGLRCSGAEIHPKCTIGPYFCLFHSNGLVIGDRVRIGSNFRCFHGVTLGDKDAVPGQPILGNDVTVYAGAKILGPIHIGDRAVIAANAVVLCDVPPDCVAVGIPARVTTRRSAAKMA